MKWVPDRTGRFYQRPHYDPSELNVECENVVTEFLRARHGSVKFPITTDELTILLERHVQDLDLYADLSQDGDDVEGVTNFIPGKRPRVRISKRLTADPRLENRLRTTLTHELAHVTFHTFMFEVERPNSLFAEPIQEGNKCKRESIIGARRTDWMEWQAGFGCGAFLMPATALAGVVAGLFRGSRPIAPPAVSSAEGAEVIEQVALSFNVSRDAARVRLLQQGVITAAAAASTLF